MRTNGFSHQFDQEWPQADDSGAAASEPSRPISITLRLSNMPKTITIRHIWTAFSSKGKIEAVEIFEARPGDKLATGRITFRPPPKNDFWATRRFTFSISGQANLTTIHVSLSDTQQGPPREKKYESRYVAVLSMALKSVDFGSLMKTNTMAISETVASSENAEETRLDCDCRNQGNEQITIYFPFCGKQRYSSKRRRYKLVAKIKSLKMVWDSSWSASERAIALNFDGPIEYFWQVPDVVDSMTAEARKWHIGDSWVRATDIYEVLIEPQKQPVSTYSRSQIGRCIDISRLKMFRCVIDDTDAESLAAADHLVKALALQADEIAIHTAREPLRLNRNRSNMWDLLDHQVSSSSNALEFLDLAERHVYLDFAVRYRLEVCVSRGFLNEYAVDAMFLEKLAGLPVPKASRILEHIVDKAIAIQDPLQIFQEAQYASIPGKRRIPNYCAVVYKVHITPTALKLNLPNVESSNRVLRRYSNMQDRFLRVQFLSESESDRIARDRYDNEDIWKRLLRTLHKGIRIGDRTFEFLAFGNSQLREASVTFFCPDAHVSCDEIREWLGNFSHIRNIAKFGARIGQCFSTTREIRGVRVPTIRRIADIEADGECFSDGVGIVSDFLARLVFDEMKLDIVGEPSAFQFRMGGAKGVLAVWPREYAEKMEVCLRQSQIKFTSATNTLEIIKCARSATATLNRQTIVILEYLGVPTSSFMALLKSQIRDYEQAETNYTVAIKLLTRFIDENQSTILLAELLKAKFCDPFVKNLVKLWRAWSLKMIKEKSKIHVEKSAFVMGCVDETGTLRGHCKSTEGSTHKDVSKLPQIFLQLGDRTYRNRTRIIQGVCLIGRNPSLHAGDIRVVEAVDNPRLHHLKDVVVFPGKGDRSLPSMLSGGDLDGDDYFVIWEPSLLPKVWNTPPMHSKPVKPQDLDRDVEVDDLRNFFVRYMKNNFLPLIATAHLAFADSEKKGVNSKICLQLAELHSQAVDYPKTGVPAKWSKTKYSPKCWPHFMASKKKKYISSKALGRLFDCVAKVSLGHQPSCEDKFDERIMDKFEVDDEMLNMAGNIKTQYDVAVRRLLKQYVIGTEFELYTGWAMTKPAIGSDYKRQEELGQQFETLKQRFREQCAEVAGGMRMERFVAAMYKTTADEVKAFLRETEGKEVEYLESERPLISFPWIFHWILVKIAMGDEFQHHETTLAPAVRPVPIGETGVAAASSSSLSSWSQGGLENGDGAVMVAEESEGLFRRADKMMDEVPCLIDFDDVGASKTEEAGSASTTGIVVPVCDGQGQVVTMAQEVEVETTDDALVTRPSNETALVIRPSDETALETRWSNDETNMTVVEAEEEVEKCAVNRLLKLLDSDSD